MVTPSSPPQERRKRVALLGIAISSGNRGVLALGASVAALCVGDDENTDVVLLLNHDRTETVRYRVAHGVREYPVIPCRMSPQSRFCDHLFAIVTAAFLHWLIPLRSWRRFLQRKFPWIREVAGAEFVGDIRGGDSFSDIYGMTRFHIGFLMAWSVILVRGEIVQFPQTYGPYKARRARWLASYLLRRSSVIIARDTASQAVAAQLIKPTQHVGLSPDVAFSMLPEVPPHIELQPPPSSGTPGEIVGLNVNGLMYHGGYTRKNMFGLKLDYATFLPKLLERLATVHDGEFWLVPHTFAPPGDVESDNGACDELRAQLPADLRPRVRVVAAEYDQHQIKGVIGQCGFFIGSRMHSCIAALSQGIPCVGVAYSMKFEGVFATVGVGDWVLDGRTLSNDETIDRIVDLFARRAVIRSDLGRAADRARTRLREVFAELSQTAARRC